MKKLAGQTAIYGTSSIIGRFLNYLLVPIYTRVFTPVEYGIVTELYAYVSLLIVMLLFGMETAFFRYAKTADDKTKVYSTTLISILCSSVAFLLIALMSADIIAGALHIPQHSEYITWFAFVIAFDVIASIPFARLREENKAYRFATIKFVNIGVNVGLNLFFIVFCKNVYEAGEQHVLYSWVAKIYDPNIGVGYIFIANLVASFITLLLLSPQFILKFSFDRALWKKMAFYAFPLLLMGIAGIVNETLDRILLEHFLPLPTEERKAQIGIYGACYKLSIIMTLAIQAFRYAAEPFFFAESDKRGAKKTYADVMKYFVMVMSVIFLGTLLYLDIIKYFIGKDFHEGLNVVPVLLLANLFLGIYYNLSIWYKLTDKTRYGALISAGGALVTIVLNIVWIPKYGYLGSAWATLVCYFSMAAVSYVVGRKFYPVNYNMIKITGAIGLAVLTWWISLQLILEEQLPEMLKNTGLLLAYLGLLWLIERTGKIKAGDI